jgi:hypothetical protein
MDQRIRKLYISGRYDAPDDRRFPARICIINHWPRTFPVYPGILGLSSRSCVGVLRESQGGEIVWDPTNLDVDYSNKWLADYNCERDPKEPILVDCSKYIMLERVGEVWKDVNVDYGLDGVSNEKLFRGVPIFGSSYGGQGIRIDIQTTEAKLRLVFGISSEML